MRMLLFGTIDARDVQRDHVRKKAPDACKWRSA